MKKRLYRSRDDKQLAGVAAGVAEYFKMDPTIVRILFALLAFSMFQAACIAYIAAAIILPIRPEGEGYDADDVEILNKDGTSVKQDVDRRQLFGLLFVGAGVFMLLNRFISWMDSDILLALAIIGFGVYIFFRKNK